MPAAVSMGAPPWDGPPTIPPMHKIQDVVHTHANDHKLNVCGGELQGLVKGGSKSRHVLRLFLYYSLQM